MPRPLLPEDTSCVPSVPVGTATMPYQVLDFTTLGTDGTVGTLFCTLYLGRLVMVMVRARP